MNSNILEVNNILKTFSVKSNKFLAKAKNKKILDNVSFDIRKGSIMALVGESGCGKTTTGRIILNILKADSGKIVFNDKIIFDIEKKVYISNREMIKLRKDMQVIFQDPYASLDPRMCIKDIVSEGVKKHNIYGNNKNLILEKTKEILNLCGIDSLYENKFLHEFSGGQRQRVGIAKALALNPKFLVCDEPTAALDVSVQSQILNLMIDLKEKFNLTYLFISHNLSVVKNFSDEIAVMYLGNIVELGKTKDIFENPLHPYTKLLISSIPSCNNRFIMQQKEFKEIDMNVTLGCPFYNRCNYAKEICKNNKPKLKQITENHRVMCFLENL